MGVGGIVISGIVAIVLVIFVHPLLSPPPLNNNNNNNNNNSILCDSQPILLPSASGPESLAFHDPSGSGPYTGVADGRILMWDPLSSSWFPFAVTSSTRKECKRAFAPEMEHICGRPLGLRFEQKSGDLYIADAYFGLLRVGPDGGLASKVVPDAQALNLYFTNDLDIDEHHDIIYFTDTSSAFRRREFMSSILSGDKTGRLIQYNKSTKQAKVLLHNLAFANGVALSKHDHDHDDKASSSSSSSSYSSYVLVAETSKCRILRYWLQGPNASQVETFAELPGYPDNIRANSKGDFWVALHAKKTPLADWLLNNTWFGRSLLTLPFINSLQRFHPLFVGQHHAIVVKLSQHDGRILQVLEDARGDQVRYASEAEEKHGNLWIASVLMPSIWVYQLH